MAYDLRYNQVLTTVDFRNYKTEIEFDKNILGEFQPDYRKPKKGIIFFAKCFATNCRASYDLVTINMGIFREQGTCNVRREIFRLKCPCCNSDIDPESCSKFGFYDCKVRIEWRTKDGQHKTEVIDTYRSDNFKTLQPEANTMFEFEYIDVHFLNT